MYSQMILEQITPFVKRTPLGVFVDHGPREAHDPKTCEGCKWIADQWHRRSQYLGHWH